MIGKNQNNNDYNNDYNYKYNYKQNSADYRTMRIRTNDPHASYKGRRLPFRLTIVAIVEPQPS